MDLWIRSQDKENLLKVDRLDVNDNKIEANFKAHYGGCDYLVIGKYRTNERALEVLDEINQLLKPKMLIKTKQMLTPENMKKISENLNSTIISNSLEPIYISNCITYEMPEE